MMRAFTLIILLKFELFVTGAHIAHVASRPDQSQNDTCNRTGIRAKKKQEILGKDANYGQEGDNNTAQNQQETNN
jgi:hypothetical protein